MYVEAPLSTLADRRKNAADPDRPTARRVTFNLPIDAYEELSLMASRRHLTLVEMLRQAIADKGYLDTAQRRGAALEVVEPDGSRVRVVFH